jgi:hypothetical protein
MVRVKVVMVPSKSTSCRILFFSAKVELRQLLPTVALPVDSKWHQRTWRCPTNHRTWGGGGDAVFGYTPNPPCGFWLKFRVNSTPWSNLAKPPARGKGVSVDPLPPPRGCFDQQSREPPPPLLRVVSRQPPLYRGLWGTPWSWAGSIEEGGTLLTHPVSWQLSAVSTV